MAKDFGSGVSRTLSALQRQFQTVIWQAGKPPLDSELNLMGQVDLERAAQIVRSNAHSGFFLDPMSATEDFSVNEAWSNFFKLGLQHADEEAPFIWANVNGWLVPVTGTSVSDGETDNRVDLYPPPSSDSRIDLVFLEVWLAQVAPNASTTNKPAADKVWKYGNVMFGGTNISDDLEDPAIGYETTERLQIQYRIRVFGSGSGLGNSVALDDYPDGLDDPNVVGQGAATSPVSGTPFTNMREELGDPGLWRAGDGDPTNDLSTVDGYTYAIPIAAVFRRNTDSFWAIYSGGDANQNGSVDRNPTTATPSDPADETKILATATLTNAITEATTGTVQVTNLSGSGIDDADHNWDATFLVIDNEVISIDAVSTATSPGTINIRTSTGRGRWGTMAVPHEAGATVRFFNWRPDDLFADQIAIQDLIDLRKGVTIGEWDYDSLLAHNLTKLFQGDLRTSFKQSGISDVQGLVIPEVDTLLADGTTAVPNQTEALDGPDGIRTIWSDAASLQSDVTMLLEDQSAVGLVVQYDTGMVWDVGASLLPGGWSNDAGGWANGTIIFLHIGGSGGGNGARETFRDGSERAVRFLSPKEYFLTKSQEDANQHPVTLRLIEERAFEPPAGSEAAAAHPGPMYPLPEYNYEFPYIVLGGILNVNLQISGGCSVFDESAPAAEDWEIDLAGLDFDVAGDWYSQTGGAFDDDPDSVNYPLLQGTRTLYGMLTNGGKDLTGASSEVYVVIWGDAANATNNGVFRVVGAGTVGYTTRSATAADRLRVEFIEPPTGTHTFVNTAGLNAELRSQYMHASDGDGSVAGRAAACIVFTDIDGDTGGTQNPWNSANLGGGAISAPVASKMVLNTTLMYHPGRGGLARVADEIQRFAVVTAGSEYLRQSPAARDGTFPSAADVPANETYFDPNHVQTWNRLTGRGLTAPDANDYGGNIVSFSEQDRESELFIDAGSKSLLFRPYLNREMTLYRHTLGGGTLIPATYPVAHGGFATDGAGIFAAGLNIGYALPPEFMPRFGRQDIPFYVDLTGTGAGTFLQGINHMFTDSITDSQPQFGMMGGEDNGGVAGVNKLFLQTGSGSGLVYGQYGNIPGTAESGYQSRLYESTTIRSSDVGNGMEGIQLPPWLGVARLYGVYDLRDFVSAGGSTFDPDRITPAAGAPPNLLRTDATKQTLYILQGGAEDVTDNANDHTYIVPENVIDITLSDNYSAGETFSDLDYVVECVVFGFGRGWINLNNYVLARAHDGNGAIPGAIAAEQESVEMVFPAPAPLNDQCYVAYERTVYQGDPYMTRAGSTRTNTDYENRYGQVPQASAYAARLPIQQFDANGDTIPVLTNPRGFEVLASMDFYTTLGTGKIGGQVYGSTVTDVGFVAENKLGNQYTRIPSSASEPPFQVSPRAFTENQEGSGQFAYTRLVVTDFSALNAGTDTVIIVSPRGDVITLTEGSEWSIGANNTATAESIAAGINADAVLPNWVHAYVMGPVIEIVSEVPGAAGLETSVTISNPDGMALWTTERMYGTQNFTYLSGAADVPRNATPGIGLSPIRLTGMIERLPLGLLLQDSDFIGEDILQTGATALWSSMSSSSTLPRIPAPLDEGVEYTRIISGMGEQIGMSDGAILSYTPYDVSASPSGTKKFRLFRGGGSVYVISGSNPGGPVDWTSTSFSDELRPVLKGAALAGRAFLVKNFPEEAFSGGETTSHGDELQMLIVTQGILGTGSPAWDDYNTLSLSGMIGPTGYGEGYAAADRYRLEGKPFSSGHLRESEDTEPDLALYPFTTLATNMNLESE